MHQRPFPLHRFRPSANVQPMHLFWGLRFALAFLLLLLVLFPSLQSGSSPMSVKGIAALSLVLLGLICFLDTKREPTIPKSADGAAPAQPEEKPGSYAQEQRKEAPSSSKQFHAFRIHSIVSEVNKLVDQQKLTRKTVELFVLPNSEGDRFAPRAIARLKAAGYAIRPHSEPITPEGAAGSDTSFIGVDDGSIHVFLGNK